MSRNNDKVREFMDGVFVRERIGGVKREDSLEERGGWGGRGVRKEDGGSRLWERKVCCSWFGEIAVFIIIWVVGIN